MACFAYSRQSDHAFQPPLEEAGAHGSGVFPDGTLLLSNLAQSYTDVFVLPWLFRLWCRHHVHSFDYISSSDATVNVRHSPLEWHVGIVTARASRSKFARFTRISCSRI